MSVRLLIGLMVIAWVVACRAAEVGPYTPLGAASRSTSEAERLNREAAGLVHADPERAEALLREALTKDLYYGPAHNNLGVVFLGQGMLYEAANEFEWARKLLPDSADPRINLALCMEQAGRVEDALRAYDAALEVAPECLAAMQGAAVLVVRSGRQDARLDVWLDAIALRAESPHWRDWAGMQSANRLSKGQTPTSSAFRPITRELE